MDLQPSVGPWPLYQFLNPILSRQDFLDEGSARRKAFTYTQKETKRINAHSTDIHAMSQFWTQDTAVFVTIFYSEILDYLNLQGQVPVFISPRNRVAQLYPQAPGFLFVASYDSQGIRTRLHMGYVIN
jgi:hypothetical protein